MPYRVRGTVDDTCRVLLFKEADMSLERSGVFDSGEWTLECDSQALRMVVARATDDGEAYGFGAITPEYYLDPDTLLAINSMGDFLAIDSEGGGLMVGTV